MLERPKPFLNRIGSDGLGWARPTSSQHNPNYNFGTTTLEPEHKRDLVSDFLSFFLELSSRDRQQGQGTTGGTHRHVSGSSPEKMETETDVNKDEGTSHSGPRHKILLTVVLTMSVISALAGGIGVVVARSSSRSNNVGGGGGGGNDEGTPDLSQDGSGEPISVPSSSGNFPSPTQLPAEDRGEMPNNQEEDLESEKIDATLFPTISSPPGTTMPTITATPTITGVPTKPPVPFGRYPVIFEEPDSPRESGPPHVPRASPVMSGPVAPSTPYAPTSDRDKGEWVPIVQELVGNTSQGFGNSIGLSRDASVLVVASPGNSTVTVYDRVFVDEEAVPRDNLTKIEPPITPEVAMMEAMLFGDQISLATTDGYRVAIQADSTVVVMENAVSFSFDDRGRREGWRPVFNFSTPTFLRHFELAGDGLHLVVVEDMVTNDTEGSRVRVFHEQVGRDGTIDWVVQFNGAYDDVVTDVAITAEAHLLVLAFSRHVLILAQPASDGIWTLENQLDLGDPELYGYDYTTVSLSEPTRAAPWMVVTNSYVGVAVFRIEKELEQVGSSILPVGTDAKISQTGTVVGVLQPQRFGDLLRMYQFDGGDWTALGRPFWDMPASTMALSYDGSFVAVTGTVTSSDQSDPRKVVTIYQWR